MKLWVDDVRPAPNGYHWCKSFNDAKLTILKVEQSRDMALAEAQFKIKHSIKEYQRMLIIASRREIELIDINYDTEHDSDYIKLLDWLETTGREYPTYTH